MTLVIADKYTVINKIATGGMAEIFLAEQTGPGGFKKRLVIKKILPQLVNDDKFLNMFQDEARVAAMMSHPNVVTLFDFGQEGDQYFIAMEHVPGLTLREIIKLSNKHSLWLSPEYIAKLASQICEGLEYAHNFTTSDNVPLNLIHRDISPQNIILSKQGIIKIVDFGVAKASSNQEVTAAGIIKGKLAYMSPEQIRGRELDRRSDIFSLGILLYELATHKRPFQGKSDMDMLRAVLESTPAPLTSLRPQFPKELSRIIFRALEKEREARYNSAGEMLMELERFIQHYGKPIGPFQLKELIQHIEALEAAEQPADEALTNTNPSPQPAHMPPPTPVRPPSQPSLPSNNGFNISSPSSTNYAATQQQAVIPSPDQLGVTKPNPIIPGPGSKPNFDPSAWEDDPTIMNPDALQDADIAATAVGLTAPRRGLASEQKATIVEEPGVVSPDDVQKYYESLSQKGLPDDLSSKITVGLQQENMPNPPSYLQPPPPQPKKQLQGTLQVNRHPGTEATPKAKKNVDKKKGSKTVRNLGIFLLTIVLITICCAVVWFMIKDM